jgi:hypothetical protein
MDNIQKLLQDSNMLHSLWAIPIKCVNFAKLLAVPYVLGQLNYPFLDAVTLMEIGTVQNAQVNVQRKGI